MADPADPEDCRPNADGELPEGSSGLVPEGPGLGLAAPLIGSLIGLLTLVVPLFAVLDDRPGHPLSPPLAPHLPSAGPGPGQRPGPGLPRGPLGGSGRPLAGLLQ